MIISFVATAKRTQLTDGGTARCKLCLSDHGMAAFKPRAAVECCQSL